jgi:uncharacterized cupin superfamily protein
MSLQVSWVSRISRAVLTPSGVARPDDPGAPVIAFNLRDEDLTTAPPRTPNGQPGPAMRSALRIRSQDGRVTSGVWDCAAGAFEVDFLCDEVVHILEGEVIVSAQGETRMLREGDVALFQKGVTATWDVPRYVRKLWFHHNPYPTLRERLEYKVGLIGERARSALRIGR